jgi:hypothetical protein
LVQEEGREDLGPCLEYVLHQDILNILVTLCQVVLATELMSSSIFVSDIFLLSRFRYTGNHIIIFIFQLGARLPNWEPTGTSQ